MLTRTVARTFWQNSESRFITITTVKCRHNASHTDILYTSQKKYHFLAASRPRLRQKREEGGGL